MTVAGFIAFAEQLADAARPISTRRFRTPLTIEHKEDESPVTIADRETEAELCRLIQARFPEHGILGEEQGRSGTDGRHLWVVDPIDGTKSFITGMPLFGTLIALLEDGRPVLGVVDMPALGERWVGAAGQPTRFNGEACKTRDCAALGEAALQTTSPDMFVGDEAGAFAALSAQVRLRRFGGDCYGYGLLALGCIDLVVETRLQPYDYLALIPIVEGAGGRITDWAGRPLGLGSAGDVLAAGTPGLHALALAALRG